MQIGQLWLLFALFASISTGIVKSAQERKKDSNLQQDSDTDDARVYGLKRCSGGGCPYTASWLSHINLYKKITWYLDSTKMEAASFNIFDKAKLKFQLLDPDAYYVHHMSMFEHYNHKKYGFAVANNKTLILSKAAYHGECDQLKISRTKEYLGLLPFYGGRPPGVTKDLSVKSIGQGNSLVDGYTKGLQTMATVCSVLKYFGHVVIGVARDEDRVLMNDMLARLLSSEARGHINVVQFQMNKPAHLPFHLLTWGQHYIKMHNCHQFYRTHPAVRRRQLLWHRELGQLVTTKETTTTVTTNVTTIVKKVRRRGRAATSSTTSSNDNNNTTAGNATTSTTTITSTTSSSIDEATLEQMEPINNGSMHAVRNGPAIASSSSSTMATVSANTKEGEGKHSVGTTTTTGGGGMIVTQAMMDSILKDYPLDPSRMSAASAASTNANLYDICQPRAIANSVGGPVKVIYMKRFDFGSRRQVEHAAAVAAAASHADTRDTSRGTTTEPPAVSKQTDRLAGNSNKFRPIKFVYYTESDQVVKFDSLSTLQALSSASNDSTFFVGKRREKARDTDPEKYMESLNHWRECGVPGYSLIWPKDVHVQID